jgi:hypothetical protein
MHRAICHDDLYHRPCLDVFFYQSSSINHGSFSPMQREPPPSSSVAPPGSSTPSTGHQEHRDGQGGGAEPGCGDKRIVDGGCLSSPHEGGRRDSVPRPPPWQGSGRRCSLAATPPASRPHTRTKGRLRDQDLRAYAEQLGLDLELFDQELAEHVHAERVREDFISGVRSGVNGTPTFYINGVRHDDSYEIETLLAALERAAASDRGTG